MRFLLPYALTWRKCELEVGTRIASQRFSPSPINCRSGKRRVTMYQTCSFPIFALQKSRSALLLQTPFDEVTGGIQNHDANVV